MSLTLVATALLLYQAPSSEATFAEVRLELRSAADDLKRSVTEANVIALDRALSQLHELGPELAENEPAVREREEALLALAYGYLTLENQVQAEAVMDELLLLVVDAEPAVEAFGPRIQKLYNERKAALEAAGRASIEVACSIPCRVLVGERLAPNPADIGPLYLGSHRVWVEATERDFEPLRTTLVLDEDGQHELLEFGPMDASPVPEPKIEPEPSPKLSSEPCPTEPKRIQPRWAEVFGITVGVGLAVAGGLLLAYDDRCPNLDHKRTGCDLIYEVNPIAFSTLLAAGGALIVIDGVMLTVDEVRVRRGRTDRQVSLSWTFRF